MVRPLKSSLRKMNGAATAVVLVLGFVSVLEISGQTVWPPAVFVPPAPTELDRIRADFGLLHHPDSGSTVATGTLIRTDLFFNQLIVIGEEPPVTYNAVFGPLAPNTYTYEIYLHHVDGSVEFRSRQTLVVSAVPGLVPTLSPSALACLFVALVAVALFAVGRASGR